MNYLTMRLVVVSLLLAWGRTSHAAFEVKRPLSSMYSTYAGASLGVVTKVNRDLGYVEGKFTETLRGPELQGVFRLTIVTQQLPDLSPSVNVNDPVVLLRGNRENLLHIANTWVLGIAQPDKPVLTFRCTPGGSEAQHSFPGSTNILVTVLQELQQKKQYSLLDKVDPIVFRAGVHPLGKIGRDVTHIAVSDLDGDGKPELAATTAAGVSVFSIRPDGIAPSAAARPKDTSLPAPQLQDAGSVVSLLVGEFGPRNEQSAIVVRNKSITREAIDEKSKLPVDDFLRLTGDKATTFFPSLGKDGIKTALITGIDYNGDSRRDVLVVTEEAAIMMPNRGYGVFFVLPKVEDHLRVDGKYPFPIDPGTKLTAADLDGDKKEELIVVTADGRVLVAK